MLRLIIQLSFFQARPQDLPASAQWLRLAVMATFACHIVGNAFFVKEHLLLVSLAETIFIGFELWLLLKLFNYSERWLQAATAMYCCTALLNLVALPLLATLQPDAESMSGSLLFILLIDFWFYGLLVYIVKETLEIPLSLAIIISLVMVLLFILLLMLMFGNKIG